MTDLGRDGLRRAAVDCAAHPELFDEGELIQIHIITVRIEHGMALSENQQLLLESGLRRITKKGATMLHEHCGTNGHGERERGQR